MGVACSRGSGLLGTKVLAFKISNAEALSPVRSDDFSMNLCLVQSSALRITETFIRAHIERIRANVTAVHGQPAECGDKAILSNSLLARASRVVQRQLVSASDIEIAYAKVFRSRKIDVVLAEYGPSGVDVMYPCQKLGIPLVVHFHGYDAYRVDVLARLGDHYKVLFQQASAIVAVSKAMRNQLIALGAPADKVFNNPCGVDCEAFEQSRPAEAPPVFLAVGRFVQKKAPHLSLVAFANVLRRHPEAELRMIGDGPLLGVCQELASALKINESVHFLGAQPHHVVRDQMRIARAFVQHSVVADDGDSEGTPVSVLEAGAGGLPVVSTRHAGIPDVVSDEETGLLVEERDVDGMAEHMKRLLVDPELAGSLGAAARRRIETYFGMERSIGRLSSIILSTVENRDQPPLDYFFTDQHATHAVQSLFL